MQIYYLKICIGLREIHKKKLQNCLRIYVNSFYSMVLITDVYTGFTLQLPQLTNLPLSLSSIQFSFGDVIEVSV